LKEFVECMAKSLRESSVERSAERCAGLLPRDTLIAIAGEKNLERGDPLPLLEAFMGGVDLRLLTPEVAEKIAGYVGERIKGLEGRRREAALLAGYMAREAADRLRAGLTMPSPPLPRMVARPLDVAALTGFLWPLFLEIEATPSLEETVEEIIKDASKGRVVGVGRRGHGATALLYAVLSKAYEEGWRIVFGLPAKWMRGSRTLVVSRGAVDDSFGVPTLVEGGGVHVFDEDYLRSFAESILGFDGVDYSEGGVESLVGRSGGSPVYLESASLLARILGERVDEEFVRRLPSGVEEIVEEAAARLGVRNLPGARVFPEGAVERGLEARLVEAGVLLRDGERGLLAYRNSVWTRLAAAPLGPRVVPGSKNVWWAAAVASLNGYGREAAYYALESLLEGGLEALDAVAAVHPEALYALLYSFTSYRIEVIAERAGGAGLQSAAAELYGLARRILEGLPPEAYGERSASLAIKEAYSETRRGFPERAAVVLEEALKLARTRETRGAALAELAAALASTGRIEEARSVAEESIGEAGGKPEPWAGKAYAVLGAIAENEDPGEAVENYKRALDVLAQLVYTGRCEYAEDMFTVASRLKKLRGRGDPRVCGGLAKCGLFDLYTIYGC